MKVYFNLLIKLTISDTNHSGRSNKLRGRYSLPKTNSNMELTGKLNTSYLELQS